VRASGLRVLVRKLRRQRVLEAQVSRDESTLQQPREPRGPEAVRTPESTASAPQSGVST
jgi:hypothetical protein